MITLRAMEYDYILGGYPLLFITSLAASSILPVGSEWLLAALLLNGAPPLPLIIVASAGNILGALTSYWIGVKGGDWISGRVAASSEQKLQKASELFKRYGSWTLLFSWLPFIGDPLCVVAGAAKCGIWRFTALVGAGKISRYAATVWITLKGKETLAIICQSAG